jgi:gas vesicle protein
MMTNQGEIKVQNDVIGMKGNNNLELPCFLLGLGAGVGLTLLFAPRSGDALRKLITDRVQRRVKQGEDWVKEQAAAAEECVTSRTDAVRNRVKDRVNEVADAIGTH